MAKRILSLLFVLSVCLGLVPLTATQVCAQYTVITDRAAVDGSDFTESPVMAEKLNEIFDGNAGIYRDLACTVPVDTTLGTSPVRNNGVYMFVDPVDGIAKNIGTSCWIYANGVYYTLFGESTGNGIGENSEQLRLTGTGSRILSYSNLKAWGVRQGVGALIRAGGHSMIVLGYDENTLTILDGNSNGAGLVSISKTSWDRVGSYVEYIIQPKDAHYSELFACGTCGENVVWSVNDAGTMTISGTGKITHPGWSKYNDRIKKVIISDPVTLGNGAFYNCENLNQIVFKGAAPTLSEDAFLGVSATVMYPAAKYGWTEEILQDYGGALSWEPYGMTELKIVSQPAVSRARSVAGTGSVSISAEGDGLTYSWYVKGANDAMYVKSSFTGPVFCAKPGTDQQVLCVVMDQYGNFVISDPVLLSAATFPCL